MSGSYNQAILVGNVGTDPEIRSMQDGRKVANIRLATSETWRDKTTGERKEKAEWHTITVWSEGLVKVVEQYVRKGAKLMVSGQLQTRKWTDKDGNDRYSTEVVLQGFNATLVMLDGKSDGQPRGDNPPAQQRPVMDNAPSFAREGLDDSVPFAPEYR